MDASLWRLLNEERETTVSLRGAKVRMVLLRAGELMELGAMTEAEEDSFSGALRANAALVAKVLRDGDAALFPDAQAVLQTLSAEEIHAVVAAYQRWSGEVDPGMDCPKEELDALKKA